MAPHVNVVPLRNRGSIGKSDLHSMTSMRIYWHSHGKILKAKHAFGSKTKGGLLNGWWGFSVPRIGYSDLLSPKCLQPTSHWSTHHSSAPLYSYRLSSFYMGLINGKRETTLRPGNIPQFFRWTKNRSIVRSFGTKRGEKKRKNKTEDVDKKLESRSRRKLAKGRKNGTCYGRKEINLMVGRASVLN